MRYVQGIPIDELTRQLNLSERQLYRRQHDALDAVAVLLARHLRLEALEAGDALERATQTVLSTTERASSDTDVDRIGLAHASPPINLLEVLHGIEETIFPFCQTAGCEIRIRAEQTAFLVTVDRVALRQALLALLTFAIDVAPSGLISIGVSTEGSQTQISVAIPSVNTERFSSIDDSNVVVCRRLIELQGGRLVVEHDGLLTGIITLPAFQRRSV
ncbi:MAG: hypothetical protein ACRDIY_10560, partial [Chloroflexota bacterium]